MDIAKLTDLVDRLDDNIDDLEDHLEPLLSTAFSATTKKLPVLDRAKLYVLVTYSIESLLFSYLRLHGQNAKEHPVFKELSRVRLYFEKIKETETGGPTKRETLALDKGAAGRIIRHGLSGNDRYDRQRAEREARENALAVKKLNKMSSNSTRQKRSLATAEIEGAVGNIDQLEKNAEETEEQTGSTSEAPTQTGAPKKKNKESSSHRRDRRKKQKQGD
ncbi:putative exosome-associated family protein [Phaeomoniella chlamydospora]|uniref:Exosome complex protein n=1 Tax=Phaeomoniella chlamydospora TaxID=158046 RepID=A0A0G2GIT2_PHACM|nr:putative exosome-associated family protein [Phaeomoniella chlamydospora]